MLTMVSCSWCHGMVKLHADRRATYCPECGHRAGLPRADCDCPRCAAQDGRRQQMEREYDLGEAGA